MSASVSEVLNKAADLLEKPGAFVGDAQAKNAAGVRVNPEDATAVCWSVYGAIRATAPDAGSFKAALKAMQKAIGGWFLWEWEENPNRTEAEVVAALRQAAQSAEEGAA